MVTAGSNTRFIADWPDTDYVGPLSILKNRSSYLDGDIGMRFARSLDKPAFITTRDMVAALIREHMITTHPKSSRDFAAIQAAIND